MEQDKLLLEIEKLKPEEALALATYMADELEKQNDLMKMKIKDRERQASMATDPDKIQADADARGRLGV